MAREFKFWSDVETKALITTIEKFQSISKAAEWLSPKINRPIANINQKAYGLIKAGIIKRPKTRIKQKDVTKVTGVNLPDGFSFDFTPKRAEMFKDHVKLYF